LTPVRQHHSPFVRYDSRFCRSPETRRIDHRFYDRLVPPADGFNGEHLHELKQEGLIQ